MSVHVPVTGYVCGQDIPITADIDNASNIRVNSLRFILRKNLRFHTTAPRRDTKKDVVTIAELSIGPVEPHSTKNYIQRITIPALPPSNLTNCGLIDLDYELKVHMRLL